MVLAAGIPLLKFAATFDRRRSLGYIAIMAAFLLIELLAQYFKAQASFSPTVGRDAALAGSDLASAALNPAWSRLLAFVFLASLPLVVVAMSHAAAERLALVAKRGTHAMRIRAVFARLRRRLTILWQRVATAEQTLAATRQALAARDKELAGIRDALSATQQELTRRPPPEEIDVVYVARYRLTWQQLEHAVRQLATEDGLSLTTIRRRVADVGSPIYLVDKEPS